METTEIRNMIAAFMEKDPRVTKVIALGNTVHVYVGKKDFEIVVRTTESQRLWKDTLDGL